MGRVEGKTEEIGLKRLGLGRGLNAQCWLKENDIGHRRVDVHSDGCWGGGGRECV